MNFVSTGLHQISNVFRWSFLRHRYLFPIFTVVQAFFALAIVYGATLLMGELDATGMQIVCVGTVEICIIAVAIAIAPQILAQSKTERFLDYQKNLPISRMILLLSDFLIWVLVTLPGIMVIIGACWMRFGLLPVASWHLVAALLMTIATYLSMGYALALWLPEGGTQIASQIIMLGALLFAPVLYPVSRLPGWLVGIHQYLPFVPAHRLMNYYAFATPVNDLFRPWVVLFIWLCVTTAVCLAGLSRRK